MEFHLTGTVAGGSADREIVALEAEGVPRKGESLAEMGFIGGRNY